MNRILKGIIAIALILAVNESKAQIDFTLTSYNLYTISVGSSQDKMISGEIRTTASPTIIRDLQTEFDVFYNFDGKPYHRFSVGLGFNLMPFSEWEFFHAFVVPCQLEVFPFQNLRQFTMVYELAPIIHADADNAIRHLLGFRYTFGERF
jgi:hypothetical protein